MQSKTVVFRASPDFVSELASLAEAEGVSRSEAIRRAVLEKAQAAPPPINIACAPRSPQSLHEAAAFGDGDALAEIAAKHYENAVLGHEPPILALAQAVTIQRLAIISRGTREDWISFIYLLDQQANALRSAGFPAQADRAHGEALALAEHMAFEGDEEIAEMVVASAERVPVAAHETARDLTNAKEVLGC